MEHQPIKPDQVGVAKQSAIPAFVFAAFNDLIARKFVDGCAKVTQDEAVTLILQKNTHLTRQDLFDHGYLNVEEAYRSAGWKVMYDKPAYFENYPAYFEFRK